MLRKLQFNSGTQPKRNFLGASKNLRGQWLCSGSDLQRTKIRPLQFEEQILLPNFSEDKKKQKKNTRKKKVFAEFKANFTARIWQAQDILLRLSNISVKSFGGGAK